VGRVLDALLQRDIAGAATRPPIAAAAGRVALATRNTTARLPLAVGGDNLLPVTPADVPWGVVWDRDAAMSLPTISRCRDLICSAVGALPFTSWVTDFAQVPAVESQTPPAGWMQRPDRNRTRQWLLAWTTDDLFFYGAAYWEVTQRYADTFPSAFERIVPGDLHVDERSGTVRVRDRLVDPGDIVEFLSPIEGLLSNGFRAISIAMQLDEAADRFAACEVPAGVLQERDGGEDMTGDELAAEARRFSDARRLNTTAAVNKWMQYVPVDWDASRMQLVEGRTYQALELARLGNTPPYLVGAPAGTGMTYLNGQQAKQDLIDFGALPYIGCIEQTLSGPNVCPRGQAVRLDMDAWLRNPFTTPDQAAPSRNDMQEAFNP
jgi:hypothetical protein